MPGRKFNFRLVGLVTGLVPVLALPSVGHQTEQLVMADCLAVYMAEVWAAWPHDRKSWQPYFTATLWQKTIGDSSDLSKIT
jgi:hypothetical protein